MEKTMEKTTDIKSVFEALNSVNCNEFTEKKEDLTYLSWASAWELVMKSFPDASYEIVHFDGRPYLYDAYLGFLVETKVTIAGQTKLMWLPVMDSKNKAMKAVPYTYRTKYGEKTVDAATMFDINTAIMRCLTKNLAMFGLGLYIYRGEDIPEDSRKKEEEEKAAFDSLRQEAVGKVNGCKTIDEMKKIYGQYPTLGKDAQLIKAINDRAKVIKEEAEKEKKAKAVKEEKKAE